MLTVPQTAALLRTFDNILILTHVRPDGDTVGCAAALCRGLRALGKTAHICPRAEETHLFTAYLEGLYSPEAQHLAAQYYYRPSDQTILQEYGDVFDLNIQMTNIEHFGGWAQAQERFFADGGIFDQIYEK